MPAVIRFLILPILDFYTRVLYVLGFNLIVVACHWDLKSLSYVRASSWLMKGGHTEGAGLGLGHFDFR